jgi:hypothetical protein
MCLGFFYISLTEGRPAPPFRCTRAAARDVFVRLDPTCPSVLRRSLAAFLRSVMASSSQGHMMLMKELKSASPARC